MLLCIREFRYKGVPQNDVGLRCDVMDNVTKSLGMKIAVRTMSPDVIVADEIGTDDDIKAINYGICSGVKISCTIRK